MKSTWGQQTSQPATQTDTAELSETHRTEAIRARANRLYVLGEMALAAQLLMELQVQKSSASKDMPHRSH
jgi:hypothetical protein